jgi:hypothetical protein
MSIELAVGFTVTIVTVLADETYALRISPASLTPVDIPITMSPRTTPGTVTVSVPAAWSATDAEFKVQVTVHVSLNKPRKDSLSRPETTEVAAAILISPN